LGLGEVFERARWGLSKSAPGIPLSMAVNRKVRALDGLDMVAANPTEQANKLGLLAAALAKVNETPSRSVLAFVLSLSLSFCFHFVARARLSTFCCCYTVHFCFCYVYNSRIIASSLPPVLTLSLSHLFVR